jgi:hypothetical protein
MNIKEGLSILKTEQAYFAYFDLSHTGSGQEITIANLIMGISVLHLLYDLNEKMRVCSTI